MNDPATATPPSHLAWIGWFLPHLAVSPPILVTAVTLAHELAHAAAALLLGGSASRLVWWPGDGRLGSVETTLPRAWTPAGEIIVAGAPYAMWLTVMLAVAAVAAARGARDARSRHAPSGPPPEGSNLTAADPRGDVSPWVASGVFFWGWIVPLGDVLANLLGGRDLRPAPGLLGWGLGLCGALTVVGYGVQAGLFGRHRAHPTGYALGAIGLLFGVTGAADLGAYMLGG